MTENPPFRVEKDGHVAWLILNRPEKRNAMDMVFFEELLRRFRDFDADPDIRAVVIRAEGKSFTAGMDLNALDGLMKASGVAGREKMRRTIRRLQAAMTAVERCRKPVIAAAHSHCVGGGVDLLSACDIRLAARDAVFSIRETRIAIVADLGTLQRLPGIIGEGWFRELALTGRDFTAEEALRMGFITHLCEDRAHLYETAEKLAREIAACSPLAVEGVKDVILYSQAHGVEAGLAYVAQKNAALLPSEDLVEALRAFKEKRVPDFKGK